MTKTYNSGDSLVVTHLTTNPPVQCLSTAERTGSSVFIVLWSYVEDGMDTKIYIGNATYSKTALVLPQPIATLTINRDQRCYVEPLI
jgi:hypothetical protein